jgi:hypothetical protein
MLAYACPLLARFLPKAPGRLRRSILSDGTLTKKGL